MREEIISVQAMPAISANEPAGFPALPPSDRQRVLLVVDDEAGPRDSLGIVFNEDYQLLLAASGIQAIELIRQTRVDAAILDIRLTDMSGIELLQALKEIDPALEVVILTAYETPETTRQALRFGACEYLNKPFELPAMREAVAKAMRRRAYTEEIQANQRKLEQLKAEIRQQHAEMETGRTRLEVYASILHDISNPLTYVANASEILANRLKERTTLAPEELREIHGKLVQVQRYAVNCGSIASRYLQLLRRQSPEDATVALKPVLDDLPLLLRAHCNPKPYQVTIGAPSADVAVKINGTDLIQILVNLAKNALQCVPAPSRVEILPSILTRPLDCHHFFDGPHDRFFNREDFQNLPPLLVLTVSDNGPGIPETLVARIFEAFFTTKAKDRGLGLGLSIVQRLIREAHGGLHLHTQPGLGTRFTVYLRIAA